MARLDSRSQFISRFGHLFEHSPWVVERAWERHPLPTLEGLDAAFQAVVAAAGPEEQLQLLRSHPRLADKAALAAGLTADSAAEQAGAGLDRLSPDEFARFHRLNDAYETRHGFPFIICVRLHDRAGILAAMQRRLDGATEDELAEALTQVGLISRLRLEDALRESALDALDAQVRRDLDSIEYDGPDWLAPRPGPAGEAVLDVAIVGGGQSGLAAAFALKRERVRNIQVFDENPAGFEGPWITYARMVTLRTPKHLSTVDLGLPSLTFRSWWEAQHGKAGWNRLGKIPRHDWMAYLRWYREVLDLPVRNETRVTRVERSAEGLHRLTLTGPGAPDGGSVLARKVIFATGIQGGGEWHVPPMIADALPKARYAHTAEPIDYARLAGKRIAILGGGASAFDNAQHALACGVAEVHVFMRRAEMPRVNPIRHMEVSGLIRHFPSLDDARKYQVVRHFLLHAQPPTNDTFSRATAYRGFRLRLGEPWLGVEDTPEGARVRTPKGEDRFDFLVLSTGLLNDTALRPELAAFRDDIALWSDRFTPPPGQALKGLDDHPYLGPGFEFTGRTPEGAERLVGLYAFNYSALASLGLSASALSGIRYAAPRLAAAIAQRLFAEDQDGLVAAYLNYAEPEFLGAWPS